MSRAETISNAGSDKQPTDYDLHYLQFDVDAEKVDRVAPHRCAFLCFDDSELAATKEALLAWLDRSAAWATAVDMMMETMALQDQLSQQRVLAAARWLEAIPTASSRQAISDADIDAIATAAAKIAGELGHLDLKQRIKGAIKGIRHETHEAYLARLVASVNAKFGAILSERAVRHLKQARTMRGAAAHGTQTAIDDSGAFQLSLFALEALCTLLMISDLTMTSEARGRVGEHGLIRNYLLCCEM